MAGKMYGISFESESEKKTHTNSDPYPQKQRGVELPARRAAAPAPRQARSAGSVQGSAAEQKHRAEKPPRLLAVRARRQVALQVLVHEEELQKIREPAAPPASAREP